MKETATELLDYVEKNQAESLRKDINWLKWVVALGFGLGFTLTFTVMLYLHNDLKSNIEKVEINLKSEMKELKLDIKELKTLIQHQK